jgi:hypothetical protein
VFGVVSDEHRPVDAPVARTAATLERLDPSRSLRDALMAVGLDQVVSIRLMGAPAGTLGASIFVCARLAALDL